MPAMLWGILSLSSGAFWQYYASNALGNTIGLAKQEAKHSHNRLWNEPFDGPKQHSDLDVKTALQTERFTLNSCDSVPGNKVY